VTTITEIAPDLFRIATFIPEAGLQFNQFLVRDEQPLLFHTGMKALFPVVHEAVASLIDPATLRFIGFSHFEADECGSLNEWLALAPNAEALCSFVGAVVSVNDFASRPARALAHDEVFSTGRYRFRYRQTPHVPHCWEAGLLFEETERTLLCSDLFHQNGDVPAMTEADVVDAARQTLVDYNASPFANYMPYTPHTDGILQGLADLQPRMLATMHGSTFVGDGERALRDLAVVMRETLGGSAGAAPTR
jgi:flavorubredoxin